MNGIKLNILLVTLLITIVTTNAFAHASRENYVWINIEVDHVSGRVELNVKDIQDKLGLVISQKDEQVLVDIEKNEQEVFDYLEKNIQLSDDEGDLDIQFTGSGRSTDAPEFSQYFFRSDRLPVNDSINIVNTIFLTSEYASKDPLHRSLIVLEYNKHKGLDFGKDTPFLVFGPTKSENTLNVIDPDPILEWQAFFVQGILHIWKGIDHILFVLVLLLTTVLRKTADQWQPIEKFSGAFFNTVKIITIFTVAHSITLGLAAFGVLSFNTAMIESIIALSIVVMALSNIFPKLHLRPWLLVFIFGLFHGLGFATVMSDLQFRTGLMTHILVMFNIGVEVGQFAIVLVVFPILFWLRRSENYFRYVVVPISLLGMIVAGMWFLERTGLTSHVA